MREYNIFLVNRLWLSKNGKLLVFYFLLFPIILFAWTDPENISNTDSLSSRPAMCMDKRNWLHVVWEDRTPGNYDIYYAYYNGTSWADTQNVSHGLTCWRPDVAVDTLNNVHVVWGDYDIGKIMWTMFDGNSWTTPTSISDDVPYSCQGPEMDVSLVTNYVHCVWHNLGAADIWHSFYNGNTWSIPENVSNDADDSAWPDVVVDSLGRIHLIWMDYGSYDIFYSRNDSISWSSPENISNLSGQSCQPRIDVDTDNNPRVVWEERHNGQKVYYTYYNGNEWINPILVYGVDPSCVPDISVDNQNRAHIIYFHGSGMGDIYYTVYNDTVQELPPENVSDNDSLSMRATLVIDSAYVHVVWSEREDESPDAKGDIYYSRREASGIDDKGKRETTFSLPSIAIKNLPFSFTLSKPSSVYISFYDVAGKKVREIPLGFKDKGNHNYRLYPDLPSGIYFTVLRGGDQIYRGKFILLTP
ncbi:hypothetical protein KAW48_02510, partial [candidate division WOR-3 bacterium]|nr:hypothetical protein [candidate division WOR-3 bacterium]